MSRFINSQYEKLVSYTPGEQPQDKKYIKLNTNESPYSPGPLTIASVSEGEAKKLCLYSDPESKGLKKALSEVYGIKESSVFVSNGSDEILNFAFMLFGKQNGAAFPDITYGFYKVFCELYGIEYEAIPLTDSFEIDINDYIGKNKFIVIANPNAPTGIEIPVSEIEKITQSNKDNVVLVDEAYIDFGKESCVKLVEKYPNLIVCQTFSKSRSLAGARLGFCFGDEELIADLEKIKYSTNPYNINRLTQAAGVAALKENGYYMENCKKIVETRAFLVEALSSLGFDILPSSANFIFAKHPDFEGEYIYRTLKDNGILVRHFTAERIKDFCRITIGSREEITALIETIEKIVKGELK